MNIEMLGVNYVNIAIAGTDYLIPHINANDKEPSWDGDVEVYKNSGDLHSKSNLIIKVPIQVKGHKASTINNKSISFPVSYIDMQNYLEMGGTVFFVVYVGENNNEHCIYYTEFLPYGLKKILKKHNGKSTKTKSITMKPFPTDKVEIANIFFAFALNMKKQRSAIYSDELSLEELAQSGNIPEISLSLSYVPQENVTTHDIMLKGNIYLYAKLPHGIELPVEYIDTIDMTKSIYPATISANGKEYYAQYEVVYKKDTIEFNFGKSTKHIINRSNFEKQIFNFQLQGTLSERIRDEEFIVNAIQATGFCVNDTFIPLDKLTPAQLSNFNLPERKKHIDWLKTVKQLFDALNVKEDLDCDKLTEKDEYNIQLLKKAVIDKQLVPLKDTGNTFGSFNIANLKILICVIKRDESQHLYNIYDYNNAPIEVKSTSDNGIEYISSYHVLLKKDVIIRSCNIDFDAMLIQLKSIPISEHYVGQLTNLLLEIIKAYDQAKIHKKELLTFAKIFSEWLKEIDIYSSKSIPILNYFQVIKRERKLNESEIKTLLQLIESNSAENEETYVGAYLLMDDQAAANIHFKQLDNDMQAIFREYPIYHFWNESISE